MENQTIERRAGGRSRPVPLSALGDLLLAARKERGLTQEQLANHLGMFQEALARLEGHHYRSVSLERLVKVADALEIEIQVSHILKKQDKGQ